MELNKIKAKKSKNKISYCIGTHNNLNYLKQCVKSINENTFYTDFEILIYAEGCTDGTNEWLVENFSNDNEINYLIKPYCWNLKYWGIGGSMNLLAEYVKTKYIIFMHSDMYGGPEFDRPLIENCREGLVISSYRLEPDIFNNNISEYEIQPIRPGTLCAHKDYFGFNYQNFDFELFNSFSNQFTYDNNRPYRKGEGAGGFIICKSDWDKIGGCDPLFAPASFEDMDWFIRAQQKGVSFILTSKSLIFHFGARGSHFPDDDFTRSSLRQIESEKQNRQKWLTKWNKMFKTDSSGFVSPDGMKIIDSQNKYR